MAKKCIYCKSEISEDSVIDFCERCGVQAFGRKLFDTIVRNMETARENQDLCHARVDSFNASSSKKFN